MQVVRTLNVNANDFFDKIEESLIYEISNCTGKDVKASQIQKGFSYTKKMSNRLGREGNAKVTIVEFERPTIYKVRFKSKQGYNYLAYKIKPIADREIEVTYEEDFDAATKSKKWNFNIMQWFYKRGNLKKINRLLDSMENYILSEYANVIDVEE